MDATASLPPCPDALRTGARTARRAPRPVFLCGAKKICVPMRNPRYFMRYKAVRRSPRIFTQPAHRWKEKARSLRSSLHWPPCDPAGQAIQCSFRLNDREFPVQNGDSAEVSVACLAESSRLAASQNFRIRLMDGVLRGGASTDSFRCLQRTPVPPFLNGRCANDVFCSKARNAVTGMRKPAAGAPRFAPRP